MLNSSSVVSHLPHRGVALDEPDGKPLVVVVGELATYICRPGETRPFVEESPIPEDALGGTPSASLLSSTAPVPRQDTLSHILSRLRVYLLDKNIIVVIPVHSSPEYREGLVMLFFEKLQVRTIIVLSDAVADTFATGLRESLVLQANLSVLCISRVEAGVTLKCVKCGAESLSKLLGRIKGGDARCNWPDISSTSAGVVGAISEGGGVGESDGDAKPLPWQLLTGNFSHSPSSSFPPSHSSMAVDLLDEACYDALVSLVGEEVYQRVVSGRRGGGRAKRSRDDGDDGKSHEGARATTTSTGESTTRGRENLGRLIASVADAAPLPVIVTGEALRVIPILRELIEEVVRTSHAARASGRGLPSSSLSSSDLSTASATGSRSSSSSPSSSSSSCFSSQDGGHLQLQPLPLAEIPWELPVLGGSLVSQLSLADLSKLRISREDALSSRGSIVHWRSVV